MIVFFQDKSIFESRSEVITNTVNCVGVMGKGIAAEYKQLFPAMFDDYKFRCNEGQVKPGQPYIWEADDHLVLNFPTKDHWKGKSRLEWIEHGLVWIAENYRQVGFTSIAMPPIGCGNGGLYWTDVKAKIEQHLGGIEDLVVAIYLPSQAQLKPSGKQSTVKFRQSPPKVIAAAGE